MIKQILFDCGGVFVEIRFREMMLEISGSEEITSYFMEHIWAPDSPWLLYDKGELNSQQIEAEMKRFMPEKYHPYLETFLKNWPDALPPIEGMAEIVDDLKAKGYGCYLLSNFADRFEEMPSVIPALQKLDGMVISYQIHMLKPDPAIFRYTAEKLGFLPEETLFVDDNQCNIEGCEKAGMEGCLFTTPALFKADLRERGIL